MASQVIPDNDISRDDTEPQHHETDSSTKHSGSEKSAEAPGQPHRFLPSPDAPPNGGLVAWLQVVGGFLIYFSTWGLLSSFPVFQTYYESGELFKASSANISWIGSIQSFLLQITGVIAGPLYDRGYLRSLLVTGSFLIVFGIMMLSLCTEYWQALLTQAFCIGIGAGLLFIPTVSLIPTWFDTRMGLAIGLAASGSSIGGVIYPIVFSRILPQVGFPWAVRAVGFIALATLIAPLAVFKLRVRAPRPRALVDWSAFRDVPYLVFTLALAIIFIGQTVLLFYISFYPESRRLVTDRSLAFYLAAIFNAGSTLGRVLPNALSDRVGVFNTMAPLSMLLGAALFCMLAVRNAAGAIVMAVATGFASGVVIALPPVCFRLLTADKAMIGTRVGQGFAVAGFGLLLAGPSAGTILGTVEPLNWTGVWTYAGGTVSVGALILSVLRFMKSGFDLKVKC
ncbi:riboflavin transporter MCH5 [Corynascus novoguineensis]|uniref:Riboflavin transporter MCH5 n=1 Tax=Corynascus novoguineensis TaxID=1126955 RepID=A0AAN7CW42_9PEZI|nr:riboflavin transporter MCH5 [Corynascus novoguineensis]